MPNQITKPSKEIPIRTSQNVHHLFSMESSHARTLPECNNTRLTLPLIPRKFRNLMHKHFSQPSVVTMTRKALWLVATSCRGCCLS
jgi:hypothetical protein